MFTTDTIIGFCSSFFPLILKTAVLYGIVHYGWFWLLSFYRWNAKGIHLPPGPSQNLIGGNAHQIPRAEPWLTYQSWSKTYGPVLSLRIFHKRTIVLNTAKVAQDLLESRSTIYSDRPKAFFMPGNLRFSVFSMNVDNPRFRSYRRLLQTGLNPKAAKSYRPIQTQETLVMLQGLAEHPEDFAAHVRRNAVAVILKVAYGYQVDENNDKLVLLIEKGFKLASQIRVAGGIWAEFEQLMPILRYLPDWLIGAEIRRLGREFLLTRNEADDMPFAISRARIATGNYVESFVSKHIVSDDKETRDDNLEDHVKWCSAALYIGGGDTTVSAMKSFFLLMALYPEIQKRAQADIDQVSQDRLPTLDDYDSLPYIQAIIKEVLRWAPVAPLGLAHRAMEDDVYENYYIPKGTRIIANIWAITHDEETYPNPYIFDPSRHLGDNPQADPLRLAFGFGRRVCPGAHFAEKALFLNFANILAVFSISKPTNEKGIELEPEISWSTGVVMHLNPFKCQIRPRLKEQLSLIGSLGAV